MTPEKTRPWSRAAAFAVPISAFVLALLANWFALRNRYVVFLYDHDMGPRVPDTGPFSPTTRSRYWMTGLVAAGAVLVLTTLVQFALGRLRRDYRPPPWWRIWLLCAGPLLLGVPTITMLLHRPTLPLWLAALTTAATLVGLALALIPGERVTAAPFDVALLALDGLALSLWLAVLPGLQYVSQWIARGRRLYLLMLVALPAVGLAGLVGLTALRAWLRRPMPSARDLALAGLIVTYVGLPIIHHMLFTDGWFYISDMDNIFARAPGVQAFTLIATTAIIWATSALRRRWESSPN